MAWSSGRRRLALVGLLTLFLALATVYNAVSTPFEAPDEIGHFYYAMHLIRAGRLPVVPSTAPPPNYQHEGAQPPLYYLGASAFVRALAAPLQLDLWDDGLPFEVNPHSTCARPGSRTNVVYYAHDPHHERFPYHGRTRVLHVARFWSSLLAMTTVAGVFITARFMFPDVGEAAWLAAGLVAFTPEFLFTAGAVSNDNLVTALTTWGVYLALRSLSGGVRWFQGLALGALAGLAALSKLSGAALLPLFLLVIVLSGRLRCSGPLHRGVLWRGRWSSVVGCCLLAALSFSAVTGWWFLRNWALYGDLTGTRPILEPFSLRRQVSVWVLISEFPGLFRSWWGVFGCTAPPSWFYLFYLALVAAALAGLFAARRHLRRARLQVAVLLVWLGLMFVAYARWNWLIHAAKGRLLYPGMVSVATLLGRGLAHWSGGRRWLASLFLALLALGAGIIPFAVMAPPVAPPPIYAADAPIAPEYPLDGSFGPDIALLGYDLDGSRSGAGKMLSFEPGGSLDLTLYWRALARPPVNYTLAVQLVSAVPGETDTLVNLNTWTGGGTYPTGAWHPGDVIADLYRLKLPDASPCAQGWYLQAILFDEKSGRRLPFVLGGQPAGDAATLALVRVGASDPEAQAPVGDERLTSPITFGRAVALDGVRVATDEGQLHVTLWWRSVAPVTMDPIVFIHLYAADGELVATGDGPPLSGGYPLSMWKPGDRVRDEHVVPLPEGESTPPRVGVGWYDPVTGERLAATAADGTRLNSDEFTIGVPP